ncbi:TRAP transporter small permease [Oceanicella sp. SM1341]|uniref:TRAP transporter small permease n=1 Tax=Oceanicella sp. SM1341 TaxID=1548889 RepID=UPI001E595394|nr:TRAP transporter small permease [Oceanicella sp. SM1341]
MTRIARFLDTLSRMIEVLAGLMLAALTVVIVASAIGRYGFATPIPDAFDYSRLLIGAAITWGFASVGFRGSHIKVDLFALMLSPKARRWVDVFAWCVLLLFTVLLCWKMFGRVETTMVNGEGTSDLRMPVWPVMLLIWAGVAAAILTTTAKIVLMAMGYGSLEEHESIDDAAEGASYE